MFFETLAYDFYLLVCCTHYIQTVSQVTVYKTADGPSTARAQKLVAAELGAELVATLHLQMAARIV